MCYDGIDAAYGQHLEALDRSAPHPGTVGHDCMTMQAALTNGIA